ncbi:PHB depolymerase family esterase [Sphingomonas sp. AOB5]|uniref:extracellular catalytic domain type 1 short-chain-length polyhydroxyalkanoate depolymerase n=1 Tax=Sphingomonas sp. AOB5 TaxID=3034017 RepID=UPI0023F7DAAD|nr:PHB depolymerase family esterase [Sphingomonas sp. AOB5]MDF7773641.1 PHB depolymerase family esterase [Sphingomonas sp. AOB5]
MRRLSKSIARLSAFRSKSSDAAAPRTGSLKALSDFGTNPGNLKAWFHMPARRREPQAMVVVLHGCTQNAHGYDEGSGWTQLANELGFAVLYPEQTRSNNFNLCFNWYEPSNSRRGGGEPLSIVQMVEHMVQLYQLDPSRVFITGLSAGGAMTSVMLATYPEVFAGGAIVAGLPYGTASSIPQALERMRGHGGPSTAILADAVLNASPGVAKRPTISLWHGTADHVVTPANADASLAQWQAVHGLLGPADTTDAVAGHERRTWRDADGAIMIEDYRISGMGHGTPLSATGPDACGKAGPHMLEAGISSTRRLADFWGLATAPARSGASAQPVIKGDRDIRLPWAEKAHAKHRANPVADRAPPAASVGKVIEDALRAAGLMR